MITEYSVLDHGVVRLVAHMGGDAAIVRAARVSYGQGTTTPERDEKLIRYLWDHKHTSPFEHVSLTFHVKCPLFVARQWQRHRTGSFSEISARYTEVEDTYYAPPSSRMARQDDKNRQGSGAPLSPAVASMYAAVIDSVQHAAFVAYRDMIEAGVSREVARIVLPQGTYTEFYWTLNLRNLFHFLGLRRDSHAQEEIRLYAEALRDLALTVAPVATGVACP